MSGPILLAFIGGLLVGLSRQLNGRLSLSTSPMISSFWNHAVGFVALTLVGLLAGGLVPAGAAGTPWYAYLGGPIGVVFVAAGSWVIARVGALNTALLVIAGQMVSGVAFDFVRDRSPAFWASAAGVALIIAGILVTRRRG
ncbi:DMT family transporter [Aureimonas leprariae]|uniref:EamA-like transporter family protein n=1 Tax=Plantimonas leprariae TaxID=2615207 RepID=A0A7V7U0Q7_9HYPH|nr:DMT family transporter [Aureimonas leprariae]KAB0680814.1 EamA-like transporter family protein [Aureimonas leprariae]